MTLKQLEYFLVIAETQNMTRAAEILNITQPPLSLQLRQLEEELGVLLFSRDKKQLLLTKDGLLLQKKAKRILNMIDDTVNSIQSDENRSVCLHIGSVFSACNRILPEKIVQHRKAHPHVEFSLYEGSTTMVLNWLDEGTIEAGIVREPFDQSKYKYRRIMDDRLSPDKSDFFMAIGQPQFFKDSEGEFITLTRLKDIPLIIHRRYKDMLIDACRHRGFTPSILSENNSAFSSIGLATAGGGVALIPYTSALLIHTPGMITRYLTQPVINASAYIVWAKKQPSPDLEKFLALF